MYDNCSFEFIRSEINSEYYPLEISESLPALNKLIYFNEKVLTMHDLSEFYRTCSVDDYYITGIKDSRIVTVNKANGGLPSARNAGIDAAKGRYALYLVAEKGIEGKEYINWFW